MPAKTIKAVYAPQMRVVYVSHPFTGNEWNNRQDAREGCRRLHKQHPDWCIVNPIDTFWWAEFLDISYDDILKHCIILLLCCDAIYLCRGWQESTGCRAEYAAALENGIEVIYK